MRGRVLAGGGAPDSLSWPDWLDVTALVAAEMHGLDAVTLWGDQAQAPVDPLEAEWARQRREFARGGSRHG